MNFLGLFLCFLYCTLFGAWFWSDFISRFSQKTSLKRFTATKIWEQYTFVDIKLQWKFIRICGRVFEILRHVVRADGQDDKNMHSNFQRFYKKTIIEICASYFSCYGWRVCFGKIQNILLTMCEKPLNQCWAKPLSNTIPNMVIIKFNFVKNYFKYCSFKYIGYFRKTFRLFAWKNGTASFIFTK